MGLHTEFLTLPPGPIRLVGGHGGQSAFSRLFLLFPVGLKQLTDCEPGPTADETLTRGSHPKQVCQ